MDPFKPRPLTILRTAAGSPPAVTQYRAFHALGCRIVAADCDARSVGFSFADAAYVVPRVGAEDYLDRMLDICRREAVDLFLPALDEELTLCSRERARFEALGTRVLVSGPEALRVCTDKLLTFELFRDLGIPTPATVDAAEYREGTFGAYPVVIKPREGRGGAGVHVARNHREAEFYSSLVHNAVVQEHCRGEELTLDVLADMEGEVHIFSPRKRLAVESGISSKGATTWRGDLLPPVRTVVKALGLVGPVNIQCFVSDTVLFTEINARIAGTAILTQAAGVPYFQGILDLVEGRAPEPWLKPAEPLIMYRYWEEFYQKPEGG